MHATRVMMLLAGLVILPGMTYGAPYGVGSPDEGVGVTATATAPPAGLQGSPDLKDGVSINHGSFAGAPYARNDAAAVDAYKAEAALIGAGGYASDFDYKTMEAMLISFDGHSTYVTDRGGCIYILTVVTDLQAGDIVEVDNDYLYDEGTGYYSYWDQAPYWVQIGSYTHSSGDTINNWLIYVEPAGGNYTMVIGSGEYNLAEHTDDLTTIIGDRFRLTREAKVWRGATLVNPKTSSRGYTYSNDGVSGGTEQASASLDQTDMIYVGDDPVQVDDDWSGSANGDMVGGHIYGQNAFDTIQQGINGLAAGGTVSVATGVYSENLILDRPVSLQNSSSPVLDGGGSGTGIKITSSNVTVQGFEIRNYAIGILTDEPAAYQNVKILDNVIHDTSNGAWGFGVYIGYQAEAFHTPPVGTPLTDLLDFSGLEISGNTIYNNSGASLVLQSLKAASGTLDVTDNHIHDGDMSAIWIDSAQDIHVAGNLLESCVTGMFISGYADGYYEGTPDHPYDPRNITATCNTIKNNDGGIKVYDGWPAELHFNDNGILGNTSVGVYKYSALSGASIDATDNWWGTIDGAAIAGMVSGGVTYDPWLAGPPPCGDNILWLNVNDTSLYVKPSENVVIDMDALNLLQPVTGVQAVLNFSSTHFSTGSGDVNVAAGGGLWDELIYNVWTVDGDLDVAVGVDLETSGGTDIDAKTAVITLTPTGVEGVTQMVFRTDGSDVDSTFFSDTSHQPVWPTKIDSQLIVIDGTDPVVQVTSPNGGENLKGGGSWTITWTATDTNIDPDSVLLEYYDGSAWQTIASGQNNDGSYDWDPVPALDISTARVRVTVSDLAGNSGSDESDADFIIDSTDPTVDDIAASQSGGGDLTPGATAVQGTVDIAVATSDNLSGVAGAPTVTVKPSGGSPEAATLVGESPTGTFNYTWDVTASTPNGLATITVSGLADNAGNVAVNVTDTFNVNKNQVGGSVSMDTWSAASYSFDRDVVFKATDGSGTVLKTWTQTVSFVNNPGTKIASGPYTLTDVPSATVNLSAKTAWSLRQRQAVTMDGDGQATNDFMLAGGDLNGTNSVNILDYSIMKEHWNTTNAVADINGDGPVQTLDYSLLKANWFTAGDPE